MTRGFRHRHRSDLRFGLQWESLTNAHDDCFGNKEPKGKAQVSIRCFGLPTQSLMSATNRGLELIPFAEQFELHLDLISPRLGTSARR